MGQVWNRFWHGWLKRPYRLTKTLEVGQGDQIIILVHGLAASAASWLVAAKQFDPNKYHIIGYDLLGFGQSQKPTDISYDVDDHAKAIAHSVKKDFSKQPAIVIAHSMGCIIASRLATLNKLNIKRCILYQPPLLNLTSKEKRNLHAAIYGFVAGKPNLILPYSRLVSKMAGRLSLFTVKDETWIAFERSLRNTILSQSTLNELKKVEVPTDIIYGRFDFVVSRSQAKNLIASNPNIVLHTVSEIHDISPRAGRYIKKILEQNA